MRPGHCSAWRPFAPRKTKKKKLLLLRNKTFEPKNISVNKTFVEEEQNQYICSKKKLFKTKQKEQKHKLSKYKCKTILTKTNLISTNCNFQTSPKKDHFAKTVAFTQALQAPFPLHGPKRKKNELRSFCQKTSKSHNFSTKLS